MNALCNSCEDMACCSSVQYTLYSTVTLSRKPFGIGHMYLYTFVFRITDTVTSQNIDLSSWDTLYIRNISRVEGDVRS
jgi:hypothetical protein